jgi:hypothetical protein
MLADQLATGHVGWPDPAHRHRSAGPNATIQAGQLVGGGTKQMAVDKPPVGGFLPRPQLLQPGGPGRPAFVYLNSSVDIG